MLTGGNKKMEFCSIKTEQFSLSYEFLRHIKNLFEAAIFIETGTYLGSTASLASELFEQVYTVELSSELCLSALIRFNNENKSNIHLFNDNSVNFLNDLIPQVKVPMVIFLDAHWSDGITAKGASNTPIIDELDAIKQHLKSDCVILIDDIRGFKKNNIDKTFLDFPTLEVVIEKGLEIFSNLGFVIFGDIAIMYNRDLHKIELSSVLNGMTEYKLAGLKKAIKQTQISEFCQNIGSAEEAELAGIIGLTKIPPVDLAVDFLVWRAFTVIHQVRSVFYGVDRANLSTVNSQCINYILNVI